MPSIADDKTGLMEETRQIPDFSKKKNIIPVVLKNRKKEGKNIHLFINDVFFFFPSENK